ncbi:Ubiquitin-specific-processing protease 2 [Hyphodiscus hymeniophilus]|uniref:ubiquitinyl hydrolase 1 n=1 Tax=Hyphodiscus hymeniophilus TaxID=353542 RepID=A0A9P6VFS5_9HELO|nr:Ubiquitin-specific-processing protease 2 [Hyphodiscus hymeniophilus]
MDACEIHELYHYRLGLKANVDGRVGKTAPRLITDLLDHDPLTPKKNGRNILAKAAPQFRGKTLPPRTGIHDCRHVLMKKLERTTAPVSQDQQPDTSTRYIIAAYCAECGCHFDISMDFRSRDGRQTPCRLSDPDNPMHHLRPVAYADGKEYEDKLGGYNKYDTILEAHCFECSGVACPLVVNIKISPPRLGPKLLSLIADPKKVYARGKKVIEEEPLRFEGHKPIAPYQVLDNLRTYLKDARQAQQDPEKLKKIAKRNKRLLLGFADECDSLFEYLDFKVVTEPGPDPSVDEPSYFWQLPLITDANQNFIDDILVEIELVLLRLSENDQARGVKVLNVGVPALKDIERSLGCFDYPRRNRTVDLTTEEHPHYNSLGAVDSFTDELLSWAYDRQCECDPQNKPHYLDCLTDIAKGRQSSDLETKVVIATSAGQHGLNEIEEAFKFFSLDPATTEGDDHIIGVYTARIDSAPRQKDEARRCLKVIASARNSEKIKAVANDQTMSLHEALEFLNVTQDTPSDSIEAAAIALAFDADKSRVARALRVIATHRGNDYVLQSAASHMETGEGGSTLSVTDAYTRLQIPSNGATFPDETVLQYYQTLSGEAPVGSQVSFDEALRTIAEDRKSAFLFAKLDNPNADVQATRTTSDEPVGLENIGNTCYLNSLLQFYYTIQPLRDVVMNFDAYHVDPNDPDIRAGRKRVGNRVVDRAEVVKAQKFVTELHGLYENLMTASTRSVKPTKQLAKSTFITPALEENFRVYRKQSISSPDGPPPLSSIFDRPIFGPEGPPPPLHRLPTTDEDVEMVDQANEKIPDNKSDSSEATLIEMDAEPEQPSSYNDSKGNQLFPIDVKAEAPEVESNPFADDTVMINGDSLDTDSKLPTPPENPPPVPPRNKAGLSIRTTDTKEITESEEDGLWQFGTQQDVTEVMGNVINLLSCAIKATGVTDSGTQTDKIYDTFYGDSAVYTQKAEKLEKKIESWANLMVYPDEKGSRDIYEALDVNYDEQKVEIGNNQIPQWTSITKLPPILQIQIQRTAWNRGAGAGSKNSNPVVFPETIYLDRYMDSEDPNSPLMKRRRQAWKWKAELRKLEDRRTTLQVTEAEISVPDALNETKKFIDALQEEEIEGIDIEPDLPDLLEARLHEVASELEFIGHQINTIKSKLHEQFTNMRQYEYKLQTVFIHRGEAGGGHYWIYLYDFENDAWREYNDEHVTVVNDRKRIFEHSGGVGVATPYFLAYVRSADQRDLVNAVFRDVKEVEMVDATPSWAEQLDGQMDEGIAMMEDKDGSENEARHVEHAAPRQLLPKPAAGNEGWESSPLDLDAHGNKW